MAEYNLTDKVVDDLSEIWDYTFDEWSELQADTYYEMLLSTCDYLAANPTLGKRYFGIAKNLFGFKANYHIIFYKVINNRIIQIIRILHGRMDLKSRIRE
jgi:toxin ParE1/3/4